MIKVGHRLELRQKCCNLGANTGREDYFGSGFGSKELAYITKHKLARDCRPVGCGSG